MEVRQALFGEHVERQRGPDVVGNSVGLCPQALNEFVRTLVRFRTQQLGGKPQIALALVGLHEHLDLPLEVVEHLDLGSDLALWIGGNTHERLSETRGRKRSGPAT